MRHPDDDDDDDEEEEEEGRMEVSGEPVLYSLIIMVYSHPYKHM